MVSASQNDLSAFCLVCKAWLPVARRLLYMVLKIDVQQTRLCPQQLSRFSAFVKRLDLRNIPPALENDAMQLVGATCEATLQSLLLSINHEHNLDLDAFLQHLQIEALTYLSTLVGLTTSTALFKVPCITDTLRKPYTGRLEALPRLAPASVPQLSRLRLTLDIPEEQPARRHFGFGDFLRAFNSLEALRIEADFSRKFDSLAYGELRAAISANCSSVRELWLSPLTVVNAGSAGPFSLHGLAHLKHLRLDAMVVTRADLPKFAESSRIIDLGFIHR